MKPTIRIHDMATNEVIDREMTDAEFTEYQKQQAEGVAMAEQRAKAETDKAALLAKLGITANEAALLLG
jgi:hypothetical protein